MKLGGVIKNISYSFSANLISLAISVFMVMFCSIIPISDFCILDGKMAFIFDMLENGLMN